MEGLGVLSALRVAHSSNPTLRLLPALYEPAETPNDSTSTLKMKTAMFAETSNFKFDAAHLPTPNSTK
jgi:hypothetical protein